MAAEDIATFLEEPHVAVLSTIDHNGFPHSVGMYYLPVDGAIHMWPYGKSQKVKNLERDPRCSVLVEAGEPYRDLKGVLIRGRAEVVRGFDEVFELGKEIYTRYFLPRTGVALEDGGADGIKRQSEKRVRVVITPERVASWDHGKA